MSCDLKQKQKEYIETLDLFNSKYFCKICRKRLRLKADQIIHEQILHRKDCAQIDNGEKRKHEMKCIYCDHLFTTYYHLKLHLMQHLDEKPYGCKPCRIKFSSFFKFKHHFNTKHKTPSAVEHVNIYDLIEYENSSLTAKKRAYFELNNSINLVVYLNNQISKCNFCQQMFFNNFEYLMHVWSHLNANLLKCWICEFKFESYEDMKSHFESKHYVVELSRDYNLKCSICYDNLNEDSNPHAIRHHFNENHFEFPLRENDRDLIDEERFISYSCNMCPMKPTTSLSHLFEHFYSEHHENETTIECSLCKNVFCNLNLFNLHVQQHEYIERSETKNASGHRKKLVENGFKGEKVLRENVSHGCDLCGLKCDTKFKADEHRILHATGDTKKPLKCHLCQVKFSKCDQLLRHMLVHQASELDFVCQICYSTFSRKQDLERHMNFHSK